MNDYPKWWNETITLYNKYTDANKTICWHRTVLSNCFWKYISATDALTYSSASIKNITNVAICRIPKNEQYLSRDVWSTTVNKSNYFTFAPGDIIVRAELTIDIDEYTSGNRSTDFIKTQRELFDVMTIIQVTVNTNGGKCSEHYHILGE